MTSVMRAWQGKGGRMLQDEWYLITLQEISIFSYIYWENPSLLNLCDIIGDIIDDVIRVLWYTTQLNFNEYTSVC